MSDGALSETALLASLRDIRLPSDAAGGILAEITVAVGAAGLCAIGLVLLLRLISRRQVPVDPPTLQNHIDALAQGTDAEYLAATGGFGRTYMIETDVEVEDEMRSLIAPVKPGLLVTE